MVEASGAAVLAGTQPVVRLTLSCDQMQSVHPLTNEPLKFFRGREIKMYRSTLSLIVALLMPVSAGSVFAQQYPPQYPPQAKTCDFKAEIGKLISGHTAIKRADDALKALLKDVPNYAIGGTFFPKGGEQLRAQTVEQIATVDRQFDRLIRRVVVARLPDCELCDLKPAYALAEKVGYPMVTKKQLIDFRENFERVGDYKETIARLEKRRKELESKGKDTYDIDQAILTQNSIILEELKPVKIVYDPNSPEAKEFAKEMSEVRCLNA